MKSFVILVHIKVCVKQPLSKRQKIGFQDHLWLNAGQKYCRMLQGEHCAILLTFIKLSFVIKIFVVAVVFVFNVPPTAKVIWRQAHGLVSSNRLVKPGIEPATPGLQGKLFIHYTTAAPLRSLFCLFLSGRFTLVLLYLIKKF